MDITERKHAEEERIRLEAHLREAQRTQVLGLVAGGVAHDLNNILTAIKGNTKLAIEGLQAVARRTIEIALAQANIVGGAPAVDPRDHHATHIFRHM